MLAFTSLILFASLVHSATICRFVCPDTVGGSPLLSESLSSNGAVPNCFWFGNGLGARSASFNSSGDATFTSSNNEFTTRAMQICVDVADDWTFNQGQVCVTDTLNPRILANDMIVPLDNTSPASCTAACDSLGFTLAGVEFGAECHCGTGFTSTISPVPHTQCNMACAGDASEHCGGPALIEVFSGPNPPRAAQLPTGWSAFASAPCAQDSAARMFTDTLIAGPILAATDTPAACVNFCVQNGFTKAGVEGGDECYCGTVFRDTPQALDPAECDLPCQGAPGVTCGGNFAIQLYTSA